MSLLSIILTLLLAVDPETAALQMKVEEKLSGFIVRMQQMQDKVSSVASQRAIDDLERDIQSQKLRYETYSSSYREVIADSENLLDLVVEYKSIQQAVSDSLEVRKAVVSADASFDEAEALIESKVEFYKDLRREALKLSMSKKLEVRLKKLQAMEKMEFEAVDKAFADATAAKNLVPGLQSRFDALELKYIGIQNLSGEIAAEKYVPPIARLKDYLLSLAAVSILIMAVTMLSNKIKAAKQLKKQMKQMKEDLLKRDEDIPSI